MERIKSLKLSTLVTNVRTGMDSVTQTHVECLPCLKPPGEWSALEDRRVFLLSEAHSLEGDGQAFLTGFLSFSDSDKLDICVDGHWRLCAQHPWATPTAGTTALRKRRLCLAGSCQWPCGPRFLPCVGYTLSSYLCRHLC